MLKSQRQPQVTYLVSDLHFLQVSALCSSLPTHLGSDVPEPSLLPVPVHVARHEVVGGEGDALVPEGRLHLPAQDCKRSHFHFHGYIMS